MSKRIVLTTYGTLGDLHPFLSIARELNRRGHEAVLATHDFYRSKVESENIKFYPIRPDFSFLANSSENDKRILKRAMDSIDGPRYVTCELVLPYLKYAYYDLIQATQDSDLLVTHPCSFASPLVVEKTGIRWASTALSPISIPSAYNSFILSNYEATSYSNIFNYILNKSIIEVAKLVFSSWSEPIRQLRAELGLHTNNYPNPGLVLALFSQTFAKPQLDWSKQISLTGFAFHDEDIVLSLELEKFIETGKAPIVFTLGSSAVHDAGNFYVESAIAAKRLGCRAVLLVGQDKTNVPWNLLSENIKAFDYAPYSKLFPRAAVIVHQGGIGTTAQALRSGRPMLIIPFSHDQPNNAARAERLGISRTINRSSYTAKCAAGELSHLLNEPGYSTKATEIGRQIQAENGVRVACDQIEAFLGVLK